jgi:hypothetical protein
VTCKNGPGVASKLAGVLVSDSRLNTVTDEWKRGLPGIANGISKNRKLVPDFFKSTAVCCALDFLVAYSSLV